MKLSDDGKTLLKVNESDIIDGSYQIPAGVTAIEGCAFYGCRSLQTITFPAGIKSIGDWAFSDCSSLQAITLPAGITTIGIGAFNGCSSLQRVILPTEVMANGEDCSSSQTIMLSAGVTTIKRWVFSNCTNLQTITLPAAVKPIGYDVFEGCEKLTWIILDSNDEAELKRITALLPEEIKSKVTSKSVHDKILKLQDKQLGRILFSPQTNQIYRFFHVDTRYVSKVTVENEEQQALEKACPTLPEEMFCHINNQGADANRYYQKAKVLIEREAWPKTYEELKGYEARLIDIVTKCIEQAVHFQAATEEAQIASPAAPFN